MNKGLIVAIAGGLIGGTLILVSRPAKAKVTPEEAAYREPIWMPTALKTAANYPNPVTYVSETELPSSLIAAVQATTLESKGYVLAMSETESTPMYYLPAQIDYLRSQGLKVVVVSS